MFAVILVLNDQKSSEQGDGINKKYDLFNLIQSINHNSIVWKTFAGG